jgi:hypothetical protein
MKRIFVLFVAVASVATLVTGAGARDRPFSTADLVAMKLEPSTFDKDVAQPGQTSLGGQFSVQ